MVSGLMESVRGEWGGDVDLGENNLKNTQTAFLLLRGSVDNLATLLNAAAQYLILLSSRSIWKMI